MCRVTESIYFTTIIAGSAGIFRTGKSWIHFEQKNNDYILAMVFHEFKQQLKTSAVKEHDDRPQISTFHLIQ